MRYAKMRKMDISNGEGVGVALFVQGCHFHCRGCFNPETWDFDGGKEWNDKVKQTFMDLANKPYIVRISILGGEPLCNENASEVATLIRELKTEYPDKCVWLYTGYDFDDIISNEYGSFFDNMRFQAATNADIVVDGRFQIEKQDLFNEHIVWAGSTNQRVIDTREYFKQRKEVKNSNEK